MTKLVLAILGALLLGVGVGFLNRAITNKAIGQNVSMQRVMAVYAAHLGVTAVLLAIVFFACRLLQIEYTWPLLAGAVGVVATTQITALSAGRKTRNQEKDNGGRT